MRADKVEPYRFEPSMERALVLFSCSSQRFWGRVGYVVDPEALGEECLRRAMVAAREIAAESGNGPTCAAQVLQRLRSHVEEGRVTREQVAEVAAALTDAEDDVASTGWTEDAVAVEVAKVVRPRVEAQVLSKAHSTWASRHDDLTEVADELQRAARIGKADVSVGSYFSPEAVVPRISGGLPTGLVELDLALGGGVSRGELCVVAGGSGDGKSMFLNQAQAEGMLHQLFVAYATLEVSPAVLDRRLSSNLSGVPIDALKDGSGLEAMREILRGVALGPRVVKWFDPDATTVGDLQEWVKQLEAQARRPLDLLLVDYADLLAPPRGKDGERDYKAMKLVYNQLRSYVKSRDMYCWTATQTTRKKEKGKKQRVDGNDVADSLHKYRIADTMVTLCLDEDTRDIDIFLAKGRDLEGRKPVATLPSDFACGMIVKVPRGAGALYREAGRL